MILFVDSNEYRRAALARNCRINGLPSMSIGYEDYKYFTKPLVTVIVDPKSDFMSCFNYRENTFFIILVKNERLLKKYSNYYTICNPDANITPQELISIIKQKLNINFEFDWISNMLIKEKNEDIFFGGVYLGLEKRQYKIVKFFLYNFNKKFTIHEIFEYFHYHNRLKESTFRSYINDVNIKCRKRNRNPIIKMNEMYYYIGPVSDESTIDLFDQRLNILRMWGDDE